MSRTIALAGNPNSGKTTLFNLLTGQSQSVGNWPGVTVERKEGRLGGDRVVDLPGVYSMTPYTPEERVLEDFLLSGAADVVLNIVDGGNIERNLYLTLQLLELGRPMVLAVNMMDELRARGGSIDCQGLSQALGIPVVPIVARRGEGVGELKRALAAAAPPKGSPRYDPATEEALRGLDPLLRGAQGSRLLAAKLLEGEAGRHHDKLLDGAGWRRAEEIVALWAAKHPGQDRDALLAEARYRVIAWLVERFVKKGRRRGLTPAIDRLVTGRYTALPIFFGVVYLVFATTFSGPGLWLKGRVEWFVGDYLGTAAHYGLLKLGAPQWCHRLVGEAVLGGVGAVLSFLPQILLLFLFLALLEDSGYMARAAYVMDGLLRQLGLGGRSFIPMLMGFGCTTPAAMAARTLENPRDRRLTILLLPFFSCSAKLPIYALFAGTFFRQRQGLVVFFLYLLGLAVGFVVGLLLKNTLFRGEEAPFLLEFPPYRLPTPKNLLLHLWEQCSGFLLKVGGTIFFMSVAVWAFQSFTPALQPAAGGEESIFGLLGGWLAPLLAPLGFGSWQAAVALLSGLAAKEAVVSTMMVLYGAGSQLALSQAVAAAFTPASALSFLVFCLFYTPCISAFATMKRELGSPSWAVFSAVLQVAVAYCLALLCYRVALLLPL